MLPAGGGGRGARAGVRRDHAGAGGAGRLAGLGPGTLQEALRGLAGSSTSREACRRWSWTGESPASGAAGSSSSAYRFSTTTPGRGSHAPTMREGRHGDQPRAVRQAHRLRHLERGPDGRCRWRFQQHRAALGRFSTGSSRTSGRHSSCPAIRSSSRTCGISRASVSILPTKRSCSASMRRPGFRLWTAPSESFHCAVATPKSLRATVSATAPPSSSPPST